jgi:hypothetical protein
MSFKCVLDIWETVEGGPNYLINTQRGSPVIQGLSGGAPISSL